jgi:hypothetical protein
MTTETITVKRGLGNELRSNVWMRNLVETIKSKPEMHTTDEWIDLFSSLAGVVQNEMRVDIKG